MTVELFRDPVVVAPSVLAPALSVPVVLIAPVFASSEVTTAAALLSSAYPLWSRPACSLPR